MDDKDLELLKKQAEINLLFIEIKSLKKRCIHSKLLCVLWILVSFSYVLSSVTGTRLLILFILYIVLIILLIIDIFKLRFEVK